MSEKDTKNGETPADDAIDTFVVDETVSSGALAASGEITDGEDTSLLSPIEEEETGEERSPAFRELAQPKLPELQKENRAKLLMQTPNRLFFYWSIKTNPFRTLNRALGDRTGNYTLVLKLVDLGRETEEIFPVEVLICFSLVEMMRRIVLAPLLGARRGSPRDDRRELAEAGADDDEHADEAQGKKIQRVATTFSAARSSRTARGRAARGRPASRSRRRGWW